MSELSGVQAIWLRELKVFLRERSRVIASIAQPLVWLVLMGAGLGGRVDVDLPRGYNYTAFIFPGLLFMSVLFSSMFYGMYIVWDRKLDFLKEVLAAPVRRSSIFLGKVLGGTTDSLLQATVLLVLGAVLLPVLSPGFPGLTWRAVLVLPVVFVLAIAVSSIGLALGSRFESFEGFQLVSTFVVFPLFFLSGALYPVQGLPPFLSWVVRANPLTYAVDLLRWLLLGSGSVAPAHSAAVLVLFAAVAFGLGAWVFKHMK
jgi:ABC-2 type transport system permease protein